MFYDVGQTLSYNCLFNFVIGPRGVGKSYGLKKRSIKNFQTKGDQFVYLRRYQEELDDTALTYFDDVLLNGEFPDTKVELVGDTYYINDQIAGYAIPLTKAKNYKSVAFPRVTTIIFEEFLIEENGYARYLKNEVKNFLGLYMSIDRYRGVQVFFLANSTSMINPYTLYFDLKLPYGSNIVRRGDLLLQMVDNKEYIENRKQTRFGKLIEGTDFADYVIDNKFTEDSKTFIMKKTEKCQYFFTFIYEGEKYGVWVDHSIGKMFVSEDVDPSFKIVYSLTVEDHRPNTLLLNRINQSPFFKPFIQNYKMGNVYFENQKAKNVAYEVMKLCVR